MCLLAPGGGKTCTCPENFVLEEDGVSCRNNCVSSMFVCKSTYKCIPFWWQCDTQVRWKVVIIRDSMTDSKGNIKDHVSIDGDVRTDNQTQRRGTN